MQRPFLCKVTSFLAAYVRGHQKWRHEKAEKAALHHLLFQKERERDKEREKGGVYVLKNQSFPSVLGTNLTMVRKGQSCLKASPVVFVSSVLMGKMRS